MRVTAQLHDLPVVSSSALRCASNLNFCKFSTKLVLMPDDSHAVSVRPSVLLAFRAANVRSFRDEFELSFLATTMSERQVVRTVNWRAGGSPIGVLPAACIFGANGSGKSNALRAMDDMRSAVLQSFRSWSPTGGTRRHPFKLDPATANEPSRYEVDLILDGVRHEYGFALDNERVVAEWAHRYPKGRLQLMFQRQGSEIEFGASLSPKAGAVVDLVRDNALVLSTAAAFKQHDLLPLYLWFHRNLVMAEAESRAFRQVITAEMLDRPESREQVLALLRAADLGIVGVSKIKMEMDPVMRERFERAVQILSAGEDSDVAVDASLFESTGLRLHHQGAIGVAELEQNEESLGTLVWLGLVGSIVECLASGSVLLADELDSSLHPALVAQVVRLFQDPQTNPRRAQLIFNSHDTNLLGNSSTERPLGRDQIWFAEKNDDGSTRLFALSDLNPRKEEAVGRRYLAGRYGATPIVSNPEFDEVARLITSGKNA